MRVFHEDHILYVTKNDEASYHSSKLQKVLKILSGVTKIVCFNYPISQ